LDRLVHLGRGLLHGSSCRTGLMGLQMGAETASLVPGCHVFAIPKPRVRTLLNRAKCLLALTVSCSSPHDGSLPGPRKTVRDLDLEPARSRLNRIRLLKNARGYGLVLRAPEILRSTIQEPAVGTVVHRLLGGDRSQRVQNHLCLTSRTTQMKMGLNCSSTVS
jgi:hypothetical protein